MKCAISPEQIKKLRAGLAKLMKEKYESNDMFFTIESFVRNVYERVLKSTGDQDTALDYARLVPKAVVQVATVKTEYMNKFTENVESFQEGLQLIDGAETEEGFERIRTFLNIDADLNKLKGGKKGSKRGKNPTEPDSMELKEELLSLEYTDRLPLLLEKGLITDIGAVHGKRIFITANINGVAIPFYRSSKGTSGKKQGNWYPIFGFGVNTAGSMFGSEIGDWVIKGNLQQLGS